MISEVLRGVRLRLTVNPSSGLIQPQKMKQLSGYLFLSLLAGSWHSVESETENPKIGLRDFRKMRNARYCFHTSSGKICITLLLANNDHPQYCRCFVAADLCNQKSEAISHMEEIETDLDANLSKAVPTHHGPADDIPGPGVTDAAYEESIDKSCYDNVSSLFHICPHSDGSSGRDFIDETCVKSNYESSSSDDCSHGNISSLLRYICQHSEETTPDATATKVTATDEMQSSISKDIKSSSYPSSNAPSMLTARTESSSVSLFRDGEPFKASNTTGILLITFLFVAVICIAVAVILVIRRRKLRNNGSPTKSTQQGGAVLSAYASVAPDKRPSEGTAQHSTSVYVDVEMVQRSIPSNNTTNASVQPTGVYEELDFPSQIEQQKPKNPDNIPACINPVYSQPFEPPTSTSNTLYAEPFKPDQRSTADIQSQHAAVDQQNVYSLEKAIPMSDPRVIYSEPKKPFVRSTANIQGQHSAVDQKNVYSLEKAIPLGDSSAIYSEPNKPSKSPGTMDDREQAAGPVCQETIQNKSGAGSGDVPTPDPSVVYAEPMKLENSTSGLTEALPLKNADQNNEAIIGDKSPSDDTGPVYSELELTQQPKPSDTNIYDNFKPTDETVAKNVIYANPQV